MFRSRSTYAYMAVIIGLVCFLFIDKKLPGTKEQEESEAILFKLMPDDVIRLEITNVHNVFIFEKVNNHWEIKKPVDTLADNAAVTEVINQIAFAQPLRTIRIDGSDADQANLKEWGLAPAAERVVIFTKDGKKDELLVGRKMAINDNVYARTSDRRKEPVRVVSNTVKSVLQKDLSEFRSRNVFDFEADKVTKISGRTASSGNAPAQEFEIVTKGGGKWMLQKPVVARASDSFMKTFFTQSLGLRAVTFVTDDASNLSQYGLASPAMTFSITTKPDEETVLQIGGPVPGQPDQVYAQRLKSNSVFTVTKKSIDDLVVTLANSRDHRVLPFEPAQVTSLSYEIGHKKVDVRLINHLWNTVLQAEGLADVGKINNLLGEISILETTPMMKDSASDLKPYGLDKPQGRITIESAGSKSGLPLMLFIGKSENKLFYVKNSIEPFIYTLPENAFDFLPADNLLLRDARALNIPLSLIKSITITAGTETPIVLTRSAGGTWSVENVKDRMVDSTKEETQASLVSQLQAKAWLGPVLPAYKLDKPVLTFSIQDDKPKPTVLHIGATLPDGNHAALVEGIPLAFEITDADYTYLRTSTLQPLPAVLNGTNAPPVAATPAPATNAAPAPLKKK